MALEPLINIVAVQPQRGIHPREGKGILKHRPSLPGVFEVDQHLRLVYRQDGETIIVAGYQHSNQYRNIFSNAVVLTQSIPEGERRSVAGYLDSRGIEGDTFEFV